MTRLHTAHDQMSCTLSCCGYSALEQANNYGCSATANMHKFVIVCTMSLACPGSAVKAVVLF